MKATNYVEWKQAVNAEYAKLTEVSYYLNEKGRERLNAFRTLDNLADFCATPDELLAWIDSKEELDRYDIANLESGHAHHAINALRRIVNQ